MHILVIELIQLKICSWYQLCKGCIWIEVSWKAKYMFCYTESQLQVYLYLQNHHLLWEDISSCYFLCSHHNWEWLVADYWLLLKYSFLILNKGWNVMRGVNQFIPIHICKLRRCLDKLLMQFMLVHNPPTYFTFLHINDGILLPCGYQEPFGDLSKQFYIYQHLN